MMMKKLKAAGLLGALALAAVTLLTSIPASGDSGFLITSMASQIKRSCARLLVDDDQDAGTGDAGSEDERVGAWLVCRYLASLIVPVTRILPELLDDEQPIPEDKKEAFLRIAVTRMAPLVGPERTCDGCVQKIQDHESFLATNGTAAGIADFMDDTCAARFRRDAARAEQCAAEIQSTIPRLIDLILANLPPLTACSAGTRRPMNLCPPLLPN